MTTNNLKILLIAVFLSLGSMVSAQDYTIDGLCYSIIETDGVKSAQVEQHPGTIGGNINIPSTVNIEGSDYKVTSIAWYAFGGDEITSVTLPNTLVNIGGEAFVGCENLTSISIPSSVTTIGSNAFSGTGISSLIIPKSVTSIDDNIASSCPNLTSIVVESGNKVYDSRNNCNAIILSDNSQLIQGCNSTVIPSDISYIGSAAFYECTGLTYVDLSHVLWIDRWAFDGCENLCDISLDNASSIDDKAFHNCKSLTSVYISAKLTTIGEGVFAGCSGLTSISVDPSNKKYDSRGDCNAIIYTKKNRLIAGCMNTVFPSDVTEIDDYAFEGCTGLTDIVIPENITEIGTAFAFCTNLQHIDIPASVTYIDGGAFEGCTSLRSFTIPSGITELSSLFTDCINLEEIIIPNNITSVSNNAFRGCVNLKSLIVESGNTVYDSRNNCNAVIETATNKLIAGCSTTIIPEDVVEIGDRAFFGSGITSVVIPNAVIKLGKRAFYECKSLTSVSLSSSITEIPDGCFSECSSLKEITVPEGVASIGDIAFGECTSLKTVQLPSTLTTFGRYVFSHSDNIKTVTVGMTTPPSIDDRTFPSRATATLYVPSGSLAAYQAADYWKEFSTILEQATCISGDANGDGVITVADYIAIAHHIMGNTPQSFNEKAADANGDGQINVADYIAVAHIIMNNIGKKPVTK